MVERAEGWQDVRLAAEVRAMVEEVMARAMGGTTVGTTVEGANAVEATARAAVAMERAVAAKARVVAAKARAAPVGPECERRA